MSLLSKQNVMRSLVGSAIAVACGLPFVSTLALAHGYTEIPKSRQSICQQQGGYWWPKDGSAIPNLACREAFNTSGYVQFVQEHEISVNVGDYENLSKVKSAIPDGKLCSAGSDEKAGLNIASPHWQKTSVRPDQNNQILVRFNAQTPHNPSFWQFYLTNANFDSATDVLTWDDLTLIDSADDTPFYVAQDGNRYYDFQVQVPADRTGEALLYVRWQRYDIVGEGFYNCSDIVIERDATPPDAWHVLGYYLNASHTAAVGEMAHLRLFDSAGNEVINETLVIDAELLDVWQSELANKINSLYPDLIAIGEQQLTDEVVFNQADLSVNQVFSANKDYSFQLSIVAKPQNRAPVVIKPDDLLLVENNQTQVHVHAYDEDNDRLTYTWSSQGPLTLLATESDVTISANAVESDTTATITVDVSDGQLTTSASFSVLIKDDPLPPNVTAWNATTAYLAGQEVLFENLVYTAKWWNRNQQPNQSDAWLPKADDNVKWQSTKAYSAGDEVTHKGKQYRAKWWTKGDTPGESSVWQIL